MEEITANRAMRDATVALARRMGPSVLYQRHRQFLWAAGEAARMARVPLILEWNNSEAWMRQRMHYRRRRDERLLDPLVRRVERYIVRRADLTVAVSTLAADMALAAGVNAARLTVVRNGVDVAAIKQLVKRDQPARGREPVIGWVGVFCQWHGVEVLVRALPLLPPATRLLLVGDGGTRAECEALASALGVSERVEFTGLLPHAEAVRRLASCDILVSPHVEMPNQRFFGSPTKLFEYMAIGRPIVASRLEQLSEVLEDGVTARLVVPGDERKLADTLRQVLESPGRGEALGVAAQRASERHSWDRRAREIFDRLVVAGGAANGTGQQWAT
jgi:glycosyltransferase involved in cell wall biosynthesis